MRDMTFEDREGHRIRLRIRGEKAPPRPRVRGTGGPRSFSPNPAIRRVTVKCSFKRNDPVHPWSRHGFYLMRESARKVAFDEQGEGVELPERLARWQSSRDRHMFRIILSPEDGDRLDLVSYTRETVRRMEKSLGTKLEWAAVEHDNTDNPHVHVVLRGKDDRGRDLVLDRDFIRSGLRNLAQNLATERLGYRSTEEILESRGKTIESPHLTEIDRSLLSRATITPKGARVLSLKPSSGDPVRNQRRRQDEARLLVLEQFGVARRLRGDTWQLADNSEEVLKGMGLMRDIVKRRSLVEGNASRPGLPFSLSWPGETLSGKILGSGSVSETSEEKYLFVEGTDGRMYYETSKGPVPAPGTKVRLERDNRNRVRVMAEKEGRPRRPSPHPEKERE